MNFKGFVSASKFLNNQKYYVFLSDQGEYLFQSNIHLSYGAALSIEGILADKNLIGNSKFETLGTKEARETYEKVYQSLESQIKIVDGPSILKDKITEALWPIIKEIAIKLLIAQKTGRAVSLRFHGDADGISAALAISSIVKCKAFQQNSAIYSVRDALRDISEATYQTLPIQVLVDFGSAASSAEGLALLKSAGIETIMIDHHPYEQKDGITFLNPLLVDSNASAYTAGYLACEVAAAAGLDLEKATELAKIACCGDKSIILETESKHITKAMVLDFLAAHTSFGNNLDFYKKVMTTDELFKSIAQQAQDGIDEAAKKAIARLKITVVGSKNLRIATFSLEDIITKGEWPNSSKVTTRVFEELIAQEKDQKQPLTPLLCIGNSDRTIILRLNDQAVAIGLNANDLAQLMKKIMPDFVEGGGGHARAGAIRTKQESIKEVIALLIKEVTEKIK